MVGFIFMASVIRKLPLAPHISINLGFVLQIVADDYVDIRKA